MTDYRNGCYEERNARLWVWEVKGEDGPQHKLTDVGDSGFAKRLIVQAEPAEPGDDCEYYLMTGGECYGVYATLLAATMEGDHCESDYNVVKGEIVAIGLGE